MNVSVTENIDMDPDCYGKITAHMKEAYGIVKSYRRGPRTRRMM